MSFANNIMSADLGSDSGGLSGPFLDYKSSGSAKYGIKPMGWSLTEKDQNNEKKVTDRTEALTQGIVLDIDTLKFGWEKETQNGAPERSWAPDFKLANFPRPDNSTRAHGKTGKMVPAWSEVFAIRVGLPTGTVATWSQATFGTWQAMKQIVELVQAEYNANTPKLPVVAVTGHEADYGSNIPIFALTRWVDRPGFMTATAAPVAMETQPAPAPAPTPAPVAQMDPAVAAAASAF